MPFKLEDGAPASPPPYLASGSSSKPTIALTTTFTKPSQAAIDALSWALAQKFTVNIDVQSDLQQEGGWETLVDLITKATASPGAKGKIVLCTSFLSSACLTPSTACGSRQRPGSSPHLSLFFHLGAPRKARTHI